MSRAALANAGDGAARGMSTDALEDFSFKVCTLDYRELQPGMKAVKTLMEKTDRAEN